MKKIQKTIVTSLVLLVAAISNLHAQDKYKYIGIKGEEVTNLILISNNGEIYNRIEVSKDDYKQFGIWNLVFREVKKLESEGWELYNSNVATYGSTNFTNYFYTLRKKAQ